MFAQKNGIEEGCIVRIGNGSISIDLPAHIQPGQHDDVIAVALGYGRIKAGKAGSNVGENAFPFVAFDGTFRYSHARITVEKTSNRIEFAQTQIKDSQEDRHLVRKLTLAEYAKGEGEENEEHRQSLVGA